MPAVRTSFLLLLCAAALTACSEGSAQDTPATSATPIGTPIAGGVQPVALLLTGEQAGPYQRQSPILVTADTLASADRDPSVAPQLRIQGFQSGASVTYSQDLQKSTQTPFFTITAQVLFFGDQRGAEAFYAAERQRRTAVAGTSRPQQVSGVPQGDADSVAVYSQVADLYGDGTVENGWYAMVRRGDIVATVYAAGRAANATQVEFLSLLVSQEQDLDKVARQI